MGVVGFDGELLNVGLMFGEVGVYFVVQVEVRFVVGYCCYDFLYVDEVEVGVFCLGLGNGGEQKQWKQEQGMV